MSTTSRFQTFRFKCLCPVILLLCGIHTIAAFNINSAPWKQRRRGRRLTPWRTTATANTLGQSRYPNGCRLSASDSDSNSNPIDSSDDWLSNLQSAADAAKNNNNDNEGGATTQSMAAITPLGSHVDHDDDDDDRQQDTPEDLGNIQIPSTGISVTDELEKAQRDKFESELVPITGLSGVAQIVTMTNDDGLIEPVRYLVSLSPPTKQQRLRATADEDDPVEKKASMHANAMTQSFVMVDIPPFSETLLADIRRFMYKEGGGSSSTRNKLVAMVITSRDGIHYDEAPAVFTTRRSDLDSWTRAFPDAQIVAYRLDIPRDCRDMITQRLDGYGPWALQEEEPVHAGNVTFVETGRPLTYEEWDEDVAKQVMEQGTTPPDDEVEEEESDGLYTPEAIRAREEGKRLLAIYTPGHTFGSLTFVFPEIRACCSGFTVPIEDDRFDETTGSGGGGPTLDFRGYVTTSKAGMSRMMDSARHVVDTYSDRFRAILPSRGDPLFLDSSVKRRRTALNDIIDKYDKIGKVYEKLGITLPAE